MQTRRNARSKPPKNVVSAFVFDEQTEPAGPPVKSGNVDVNTKKEGAQSAQSAHVFRSEPSHLTFIVKVRNIVQFTFENIRDNVVDRAPVADLLKRSVTEMKSLQGEASKRFGPETQRRFRELVQELEAFLEGENSTAEMTKDLQSVFHYRHYVRVAWLSHFILGDLTNSDLNR